MQLIRVLARDSGDLELATWLDNLDRDLGRKKSKRRRRPRTEKADKP